MLSTMKERAEHVLDSMLGSHKYDCRGITQAWHVTSRHVRSGHVTSSKMYRTTQHSRA